MRSTLFLVAFACFQLASGGPVESSLFSEDCDPIFKVFGRHYVPRTECIMSPEKLRTRRNYIEQKYLEKFKSDKMPNDLLKFLDLMTNQNLKNWTRDGLLCTACTAGVQVVRYLLDQNISQKDILDTITTICVDFNIYHSEVCKGTIELYGSTAMEIVKKSTLDAEPFCSVLLNGMCFENSADIVRWDVELPATPKPPLLVHKENPGKPKLKVLHLSDTHWDADYVVGTPATCKEPMCCRNISRPSDEMEKAGKWGGWQCDIPEATFDSFIQHVQKEHSDIDYIIWTGDIPAHGLWEQNVDANRKILYETVKKLKKAFPNTVIYPALGNHESVPPNLYPTKNHTNEDPLLWLYSEINKEWSSWLPNNNSETIMRGGFYSVLIRPGLRLVSMNMNYCYNMNWWLMVDGVDPEKELRWLIQVLAKAEEKGEKVHIIGHVPPGYNDCVKAWQTNYYKVINRFENTVTGQFFGHTHNDEIEIFYDQKETNRAFGIAYLAPSLTTYTYLNPGYRIYQVDGDYEGSTRYVLDHETWIMDLEKSNKEGVATWSKSYSAKNAYNLKSLFPHDWDSVYQRMLKDENTLKLYLRHYWKNSPKQTPCDAECKVSRLCDIRSCVQYGKPKLQNGV